MITAVCTCVLAMCHLKIKVVKYVAHLVYITLSQFATSTRIPPHTSTVIPNCNVGPCARGRPTVLAIFHLVTRYQPAGSLCTAQMPLHKHCTCRWLGRQTRISNAALYSHLTSDQFTFCFLPNVYSFVRKHLHYRVLR